MIIIVILARSCPGSLWSLKFTQYFIVPGVLKIPDIYIGVALFSYISPGSRGSLSMWKHVTFCFWKSRIMLSIVFHFSSYSTSVLDLKLSGRHFHFLTLFCPFPWRLSFCVQTDLLNFIFQSVCWIFLSAIIMLFGFFLCFSKIQHSFLISCL